MMAISPLIIKEVRHRFDNQSRFDVDVIECD
jgi:hypothetical protein